MGRNPIDARRSFTTSSGMMIGSSLCKLASLDSSLSCPWRPRSPAIYREGAPLYSSKRACVSSRAIGYGRGSRGDDRFCVIDGNRRDCDCSEMDDRREPRAREARRCCGVCATTESDSSELDDPRGGRKEGESPGGSEARRACCKDEDVPTGSEPRRCCCWLLGATTPRELGSPSSELLLPSSCIHEGDSLGCGLVDIDTRRADEPKPAGSDQRFMLRVKGRAGRLKRVFRAFSSASLELGSRVRGGERRVQRFRLWLRAWAQRTRT